MTTITIINNLDKHVFNSHKRTTVHFNVWKEDGSVLYKNASFFGHLSKATCHKIISTHYLSDEEYFEEYKETRKSGISWAYEKFGDEYGYFVGDFEE
ncbi:hypothetical protein F7R25_04070 [Burkholderia stagnalis]|uniref:Uncharacterized protein n=1 Tax=Burkholderia stagnalis TaxID=1503054 RepID=A0A6L3N5I2_9BURK|nr:hypothetical protein [Burkholderia stagnalis]KAB0640681.1 hypothetical protein F7R25_04070 [Burkholderia stagnalis]VWB06469.1 hypothetical protein BST28156_00123 [Burkholderia stagnalis]